MKHKTDLIYRRVLILTEELLIANHLTIILAEIGISNYNIILEVRKAVQLIKYAGHDVLLVSKRKFIELKKHKLLHHFEDVEIVILGSGSKLKSLEKYKKLAIPFVNHDVKKIFMEDVKLRC